MFETAGRRFAWAAMKRAPDAETRPSEPTATGGLEHENLKEDFIAFFARHAKALRQIAYLIGAINLIGLLDGFGFR